MRARGVRVAGGPGQHARVGAYARAALDHLGVDVHVGEFDTLRDLRNQSEYDAVWVTADHVASATVHVVAIVEAVHTDLPAGR
jgi:protein-L-isoaspartate O-methyltransferase